MTVCLGNLELRVYFNFLEKEYLVLTIQFSFKIKL